MARLTRRERDLLRLAVLQARLPLATDRAREYRALTLGLGLVTDDEWDTLLARLRDWTDLEG